MSQLSNADHSFDSSFIVNGDISILPDNIDELVRSTEVENTDIPSGSEKGINQENGLAGQVFARTRGASRKLKLPKTFTNINKLNKAIYNDHKFLRNPKIKDSEEMRELIVEKCKIWKVINDPNVNDRIMSLDVPFIMDKLVSAYYRNINSGTATQLTVAKNRGKNLTQFEYNLIYHNELTLENLLINNFTTKKNRTVKFTALKENYKRYFDVKNKRIVVHNAKNYKEVIPPMILLETVLQIHLLNNHIKLEPLYRQLLRKYVNVTRNVVRDSLQACNLCKAYEPRNEVEAEENEEINASASPNSENIFTQKVQPWERVQLEVYDLKDDRSKIIILRDCATRFEWVQEIDRNIACDREQIAAGLKRWLLSNAAVVPVTFFSIAIDCDSLHAILSMIGYDFSVKFGAVYLSTASFKKQRLKNEEKFSQLALDEVYETTYRRNNEYLSAAGGVPRKLLFSGGTDFAKIEALRQAKQARYASWDNIFIEQ